MKKILLIFSGSFLSLFAQAQPGSLDNTFSSDGKVITAVGSAENYGKSVAVQADGKIVVGGYAVGAAGYDFSATRYNTDGSLDMSFGTGGSVLTDFGGSTDEAYAVLIQPDGKIVLVGKGMLTYTDDPSTYDFAVARYTTNGILDTSFAGGGRVTTDIYIGSPNFAYAAALQTDGGIVI